MLNFGGEEERVSLRLAKNLREAGIACEVYPESAKMKKQMEYANRRAVPWVVIVGSDELASGRATVKNMATGVQEAVTQETALETIRAEIARRSAGTILRES